MAAEMLKKVMATENEAAEKERCVRGRQNYKESKRRRRKAPVGEREGMCRI